MYGGLNKKNCLSLDLECEVNRGGRYPYSYNSISLATST